MKARYLFIVWFVLFSVSNTFAVQSNDIQDIRQLINTYGKTKIIKFITDLTGGCIFIYDGINFNSFFGIPDENLVTAETIFHDLEVLGVKTQDLEAILMAQTTRPKDEHNNSEDEQRRIAKIKDIVQAFNYISEKFSKSYGDLKEYENNVYLLEAYVVDPLKKLGFDCTSVRENKYCGEVFDRFSLAVKSNPINSACYNDAKCVVNEVEKFDPVIAWEYRGYMCSIYYNIVHKPFKNRVLKKQ